MRAYRYVLNNHTAADNLNLLQLQGCIISGQGFQRAAWPLVNRKRRPAPVAQRGRSGSPVCLSGGGFGGDVSDRFAVSGSCP
jgi:hypothetical protein